MKEIESRKITGDLNKKRVACARCGSTWIELAGLIVGKKEGSEDLCLHIGMESVNCQTCGFRQLECPKCGSKDVYEIKFAEKFLKRARRRYSR
jgi:DNA-directed RNA polymerase subunit RPC12/RpoP